MVQAAENIVRTFFAYTGTEISEACRNHAVWSDRGMNDSILYASDLPEPHAPGQIH